MCCRTTWLMGEAPRHGRAAPCSTDLHSVQHVRFSRNLADIPFDMQTQWPWDITGRLFLSPELRLKATTARTAESNVLTQAGTPMMRNNPKLLTSSSRIRLTVKLLRVPRSRSASCEVKSTAHRCSTRCRAILGLRPVKLSLHSHLHTCARLWMP